MKKEYIKPENQIYKITLHHGLLEGSIPFGEEEVEQPDEEEIGAREDNNNRGNIWDNAW